MLSRSKMILAACAFALSTTIASATAAKARIRCVEMRVMGKFTGLKGR